MRRATLLEAAWILSEAGIEFHHVGRVRITPGEAIECARDPVRFFLELHQAALSPERVNELLAEYRIRDAILAEIDAAERARVGGEPS